MTGPPQEGTRQSAIAVFCVWQVWIVQAKLEEELKSLESARSVEQEAGQALPCLLFYYWACACGGMKVRTFLSQ